MLKVTLVPDAAPSSIRNHFKKREEVQSAVRGVASYWKEETARLRKKYKKLPQCSRGRTNRQFAEWKGWLIAVAALMRYFTVMRMPPSSLETTTEVTLVGRRSGSHLHLGEDGIGTVRARK